MTPTLQNFAGQKEKTPELLPGQESLWNKGLGMVKKSRITPIFPTSQNWENPGVAEDSPDGFCAKPSRIRLWKGTAASAEELWTLRSCKSGQKKSPRKLQKTPKLIPVWDLSLAKPQIWPGSSPAHSQGGAGHLFSWDQGMERRRNN